MFVCDQYELIDFGRGRKLERFESQLLVRPSTAAQQSVPAATSPWSATAHFAVRPDGTAGWTPPDALPAFWKVRHGSVVFELRPTPFGHLGLFPEQAENWDWLQGAQSAGPPLRVLNLFAYTGGSTLTAAAAGAEVAHVDAARNVVAWARRNAEHSGLAAAPIRWISEDAAVFVRRELQRGRRYDALILDPPSYGHGRRGRVWKIEQHLEPLLNACAQLLRPRPRLVLLTCHSPGWGPSQLRQMLARTCIQGSAGRIEAWPLTLRAADGRRLECGAMARWSAMPGGSTVKSCPCHSKHRSAPP